MKRPYLCRGASVRLVLLACTLSVMTLGCDISVAPRGGPLQGRYELTDLYFAFAGDTVDFARDTVPGAYWWLEFFDDENVRGEGRLGFWSWPGFHTPDNDSIPLYLLGDRTCSSASCPPQLFEGLYVLESSGFVELVFREFYGGQTWVSALPWTHVRTTGGADFLIVDVEEPTSRIFVQLERVN